jgi:hypothetical protein
MAKDLIIGCVTDYKYNDISTWVNSIERSGFDGIKVVIGYDLDKDVVDKLVAKDFTVFGFQKDSQGNFTYPKSNDFNIVVERFVHMWFFLSQIEEDIRYVIATDVRDVVFQDNPSLYLDNIDDDIIVGAENFRYKDEPWNKNNMNLTFGPKIYDNLKDTPIYCAGVIVGKRNYVQDLFLNIFLLCRGMSSHVQGGGGPDQAALNTLLSLMPYKNITKFTTPEDNFICHVGTTLPAILAGSGDVGYMYKMNPSILNEYKKTMLYSDSVIDNDTVYNNSGEKYFIIHQFDRAGDLKDKVLKKYGD